MYNLIIIEEVSYQNNTEVIYDARCMFRYCVFEKYQTQILLKFNYYSMQL